MMTIYRYFLLLTMLLIPNRENERIIFWTENVKLQFSDFRGTKPLNSNYCGSACSQYQTEYTISGDSLKYRIACYFDKDSSWLCKSDTSLLQHEQVHFDIAEVFARIIRKYLNGLKYKATSYEVIDENIKSLSQLGAVCDSIYDIQTHHGTKHNEQYYWNNRIAKMLDSLKEYENPEGSVKIK